MSPIKKSHSRDLAYAKKGNFTRDLAMLREWVTGESFKNIGRHYGCRPSLTATTCRRLATRIIEMNQWHGILTKGKYDGAFPKDTRKIWLNAINKFEKELNDLAGL